MTSSTKKSQEVSPDNDRAVQPGIFDPRDVPIWQEATENVHRQIAVPGERLSVPALQQRFAEPPPWEQELRRELYPKEHSPRDAAVLIGLQPWQPPEITAPTSGLRVVLTQRTPHLRSHGGQIAFPGGKIDDEDPDAVAAALREAHEEVGVPSEGVEVLGQLPLYITGTGYHVTPVVAGLPPTLEFAPNPFEVDEVFTVPLDFLMDPQHHRLHQWQPAHNHRREWFSMPYYDLQAGRERYIWGVTAGILRNLYRFLAA